MSMRLFRTWSEVPADLKGGVLSLGNFDGLHLGHQAVLAKTVELARAEGVPAGVMTFEPHPRLFFQPDQEAFLLSPFRIKARLIEALGLDYLFVQSFDADFSRRSAESFLEDVLLGGLGVSHVVVGYDYVFGHRRQGNIELLKQLSARHGFGVTSVGELKLGEGARYSSTNVRNLLKDGKPDNAARLLGRYWEIEGRVEHGDARGRTLGFPTANVPYRDYLHPKKGVYAVRAGIDRGTETVWHDGVANFGNRPTFDKKDVLLEVHLFDFDDDLYAKHLRVALVDYIRPEQKFADLAALKAQIANDSHVAREALAAQRFPLGPAPFVALP
jgi:riboflavin kinase / FMN adenylyltransferase